MTTDGDKFKALEESIQQAQAEMVEHAAIKDRSNGHERQSK
jgi:hypothetical protein